jgi:hypothetical protein
MIVLINYQTEIRIWNFLLCRLSRINYWIFPGNIICRKAGKSTLLEGVTPFRPSAAVVGGKDVFTRRPKLAKICACPGLNNHTGFFLAEIFRLY